LRIAPAAIICDPALNYLQNLWGNPEPRDKVTAPQNHLQLSPEADSGDIIATCIDIRQEPAQRSISTKDQEIRAGQWQDKETTNT